MNASLVLSINTRVSQIDIRSSSGHIDALLSACTLCTVYLVNSKNSHNKHLLLLTNKTENGRKKCLAIKVYSEASQWCIKLVNMTEHHLSSTFNNEKLVLVFLYQIAVLLFCGAKNK